jgi:hypothetical protein
VGDGVKVRKAMGVKVGWPAEEVGVGLGVGLGVGVEADVVRGRGVFVGR